MPSLRHIRLLAAAVAAVLAFHAAPLEAATESKSKESSSKKNKKPAQKTAAARNSSKKPVVASRKSSGSSSKKSTASSRKSGSASKTSVAKTPPQKIDIAKLQPAPSLYRKSEATAPASRSLSFFGSFASSYNYDSRMLRAAEIASARAYGHSHGSCWRYVKNALLAAGVIDSRPTSGNAKDAASELTSSFGFRRISCSDPFKAPLGSVLVYGGHGAGHVEFRTKAGFVSDFSTPNPSKRPLIGVYVKP
jgi:hypothetical protein